ncbi:T6SS effector BTH_I2691 family protein [Oxalobacteraceae bacterium A2-2]
MPREHCSYCGRKGLLIYPVRYALACPAGADGVPGLQGNFLIEGAPAHVRPAKYTLRAVRTGFLYTYDEKRRRLKGYIVMDRGRLWQFPIDLPPPPAVPLPYSCIDPVDGTLSLCVDITHTAKDPATNLWIGWSNTPWTAALLRKVDSAGWREGHMRCVNVPLMLSGQATHTQEFASGYRSIAHFSCDVPAMAKAFGFSNTPINHEIRRRRWAPDMLKAFSMQEPHRKAYIVAVDDPVGMTNDLAELTVPTQHSGFDPTIYHAHIVDQLLSSAEEAVKAQAAAKFDAAERIAQADESMPADGLTYTQMRQSWEVLKAGGVNNYEKRRKEQERQYGKDVGGRRKAAEENAWNELITEDGKPLLDTARRSALPRQFEQARKAYEPVGISLALCHGLWLDSEQLAGWMHGVHDDADLDSGFSYRESLTQCIGKAAGTEPCNDLLTAWLKKGDVENTRNLYARALLFNHDEVIKAAQHQFKGSDFKITSVLSIYKAALKKAKGSLPLTRMDTLALTTSGLLARALGQASSTVMRNVALLSLSLLGRVHIRPSNLNAVEVGNWIITQAKEHGVEIETRAERRRVQLETRKFLYKARSVQAVCAYELDMEELRRDLRITGDSLKKVEIPGYRTTVTWLSSKEFQLGTVAAILNIVTTSFALQNFKNADQFEQRKALVKLTAAGCNLLGAVIEGVGTMLEKAATHPISEVIKSHWVINQKKAQMIVATGKGVAALGSAISAISDLFSAYSAWSDGQSVRAGLYGASAGLGFSLAYISFATTIVVAWQFFVAALALPILIAMLSRPKLQKWIFHCYFSLSLESQRYGSVEKEVAAFNDAMED